MAAVSGVLRQSELPQAWFVGDRDHAGISPSTVFFTYGPAFAERDEAVAWLRGIDGQRWADDAHNYFLLRLAMRPAASGEETSEIGDQQ